MTYRQALAALKKQGVTVLCAFRHRRGVWTIEFKGSRSVQVQTDKDAHRGQFTVREAETEARERGVLAKARELGLVP